MFKCWEIYECVRDFKDLKTSLQFGSIYLILQITKNLKTCHTQTLVLLYIILLSFVPDTLDYTLPIPHSWAFLRLISGVDARKLIYTWWKLNRKKWNNVEKSLCVVEGALAAQTICSAFMTKKLVLSNLLIQENCNLFFSFFDTHWDRMKFIYRMKILCNLLSYIHLITERKC